MAERTPLAERVTRSLASGARALALITTEEDRATAVAEQAAAELGWELHTWSAASGTNGSGEPESLEHLLIRLGRSRTESLWVLLDGAEAISDPVKRRALRELAQRTTGPAVMLVGPSSETIHAIPELVIERLALPDRAALAERIRWAGDVMEQAGQTGARRAVDDMAEILAEAAVGLELRTLERILAEGLLAHGLDRRALTEHMMSAKVAHLHRFELLQRVAPTPMDELGGLENLKRWLSVRVHALESDARVAGIPAPRGVLLIGVQGCGKSLAARATADALGLPLFRSEPGRLFGSTVGESEANLQRMTELAERLAPIVLWLDEIDKGLAGVEGSASDAGTTARVVGALLTWLQERQHPVFVVATANRVDTLPPELLRRGRLDETFFVDLPSADEREAIVRIHLERIPLRVQGRAPPLGSSWSSFAAVAREADGFSGAELESALIEARLEAYAAKRPITAEDLRRALSATVPLSRARAETIEALRRWASERARRA